VLALESPMAALLDALNAQLPPESA
jgi:hypothetical protein